MNRRLNVVATALGLSLAPAALGGRQIDETAFSGSHTIESFEGFMVGPNIGTSGGGYLIPGSVVAFDFGSGVSLTGPIPNTSSGAIIGDWNIGSALYGTGGSGDILSSADVPFGEAYMGINLIAAPIEFTFDEPQTRVGAFVTSTPGTVTMQAFDRDGFSLGMVSVPTVNIADWGTNFLGFEDARGIKRVVFTEGLRVLDNLMFETVGVWAEVGDAGQNGIDEAQMTVGPGPLGLIGGEIASADDVDLYCIRITEEALFSASTLSGASFNTTMYLFDVAGNGVVFNDDDGGPQSTIDSTLVDSNGIYFLAISAFGPASPGDARALDELAQPIFSYPSAAQTPANACGGPARPDCNTMSGRLLAWVSGGIGAGEYVIALTGVESCSVRCPTTLHVNQDSVSIQSAINLAVNGDTIIVDIGQYNENLTITDKMITLRSVLGPEATIIDGNGSRALVVEGNVGPLTCIEGFTIQEGTDTFADLGMQVMVQGGAAPLLRDVTFPGQTEENSVLIQGNAAPIFDRCEFDGGMAFEKVNIGPADARFTNCLFTNNGDDITLFVGPGLIELFNCTITENPSTYILFAGMDGEFAGANNIIFSNAGGYMLVDPDVAFSDSIFPGGTGSNLDTDPLFLDPSDWDFRPGAGSPAIDSGNCFAYPRTSEILDLDGALRVQDVGSISDIGPICPPFAAIDRGCYEASPGTPSECRGDADGNQIVNFADITEVLINWLEVCP